MAIDFPNSPTIGDSFTVGNRTWIWDGTAWELSIVSAIPNTIVDAKGDLIAATAADTAGRLAVGTNEYRLVADSGESTGLKYVADTTNYAVAAKGDLLAGTAADTLAALSVGTDGYVLTADSAEATGIKWGAPAGAGKVLQVVEATYSGNDTYSSGTFTDTGLTLTITPSAATSKVLVFVAQYLYITSTNNTNTSGMKLLRGATEIFDAHGTADLAFRVDGANIGIYATFMKLDSPATTSATTYKTQIRDTALNTTVYSSNAGETSVMIAMEIGA